MAEGGAENETAKLGRNSDGTFAKGNKISVGNSGRPKDKYSHRALAARRAEENPESIQKDLDVLDEIIANPDNSPMEKAKAIELKIKLFGGFDVQETKTELTGKVENAIPFSNLSQKEVEALLKKYDKR